MNDPYTDAAKAETDYFTHAENRGASKEHADRVLRQAIVDVSRGDATDPYELARLQLAADLHQAPR
ncbi:hypothetical protein [Saccharothrix sp. NRRL B-16348]|uniref:hypothetical protein n=1 Tax=Saccharothrix sp. NRRL B-16348 TaxID=1415542 RepID=UPI0012FCA1C5|nr:hypothetical protein [Saccharothrix sp. NRRL B-16348]